MNLSEEFEKVARSRRSVRVFTEEKVPEAVLEHCLDLALLAPNSSNLQPWDFFWAQTPGKKRELARACFDQPAARTASDLIAVVARPDLWRRGQKMNLDYFRANKVTNEKTLAYYEKLVPLAYRTDPFGILGLAKTLAAAAIGLFKPSYRGPFGRSGNRLWATKTAALAAENLMLAVRAAGYDSCPMEGFDHARAKKLLSLPCGASVAMIIGIGRRAEGGVYGPQFRGPREAFVHKI